MSKVLNGRPDVAPTTRDQVQRLIVSLGYQRPNSPVPDAPPLLDMVLRTFDGPWAVEVVEGAMNAAQARGLTLALTALDKGDEARRWLDHIMSRGTRGVMLLLSPLTARQRAQLDARRMPLVVVDPRDEPGPEVNSVGATNWSGGLAATNHLIELGHRRIATITGPSDLLCSRARLHGYRAALETAGLLSDPRLICEGDFRVDSGYREATRLLQLAERPTAILAGSDMTAFGVLEAARELRLRVPEDVSVVGFDDLAISRWTRPALTTVKQPLAEMAELAVSMLTDDPERAVQTPRRVELATQLIVRESTSPPSAR